MALPTETKPYNELMPLINIHIISNIKIIYIKMLANIVVSRLILIPRICSIADYYEMVIYNLYFIMKL